MSSSQVNPELTSSDLRALLEQALADRSELAAVFASGKATHADLKRLSALESTLSALPDALGWLVTAESEARLKDYAARRVGLLKELRDAQRERDQADHRVAFQRSRLSDAQSRDLRAEANAARKELAEAEQEHGAALQRFNKASQAHALLAGEVSELVKEHAEHYARNAGFTGPRINLDDPNWVAEMSVALGVAAREHALAMLHPRNGR